jgi:MFS family permease
LPLNAPEAHSRTIDLLALQLLETCKASLAGRTSRKASLVVAAISGGVFGVMAGSADTLLFFLVASTLMSACVIGVGPIANAVMADTFDDKSRSKAVGTFYGVSTLLSSFFGPATAQLSGFTEGWRCGT